jgi:hypothetical protein
MNNSYQHYDNIPGSNNDRERMIWCIRTVRSIAGLSHNSRLGLWANQATTVANTLKRLMGYEDLIDGFAALKEADAAMADIAAQQSRAEFEAAMTEELGSRNYLARDDAGNYVSQSVRVSFQMWNKAQKRPLPALPTEVALERQTRVKQVVALVEKWVAAERDHTANLNRGGSGFEERCSKAERAATVAIQSLADMPAIPGIEAATLRRAVSAVLASAAIDGRGGLVIDHESAETLKAVLFYLGAPAEKRAA